MTGHLSQRAAGFAAIFLLTAFAAEARAADLPGRAVAPVVRTVPTEPAATGTVVAQATTEEAPAVAEEPTASPAEAPAAAPAPTDGRPPVPEFLRRSGSKAGGPANELNTGDARARERPPGGSVLEMLSGRNLYHGNFCGPGDRGPGAEPTDALDAVCQRHDACYTAAGHRSCGCDREFRKAALTVASDASLSRAVRARAASAAESTPFMNCSEP